MESLRAAISMGITISEYNEMTPYELTIHAQEFNKKETYMQKERITAAYLGAYWERVKKMPDLKELLEDKPQEQKKKEEQTGADMFAEVKRLNAMFGGTVT